jgi:hypothetical protein
MHWLRTKARFHRGIQRLLSPRRIFATLVATIFLALYAINGVLIVMTRQPVEPDTMVVWLGGAMVLYAMFHLVRASWQEPVTRLGLSEAESLWIGRSPIPDFVLVLYRIACIAPSTWIKCLLISVVMLCDVSSPLRLVTGLFLSLMVLESLRMIADLVGGSLSKKGRLATRCAATAMAIALLLQIIAQMVNASAGATHPLALLAAFSTAIAETTDGAMVRSLAVVWQPMTQLAMASDWGLPTVINFGLSILILLMSFATVVCIDFWAKRHQAGVERLRLNVLRISQHEHTRGQATGAQPSRMPLKSLGGLPHLRGIGPLIARQWVGVIRYRWTIMVSLGVPALLSLSPLWTSPNAGLLHVAAWVAVATILLAPPALRIDFRRDIGRMWLLKSLPISPLAMTVGQILLPSAITIVFQTLVVALACCLTPVSPAAVLLLLGVLSGFAVFSFALENAVFLTFPHQQKQEGLAMMVRTKLVFLGKGLLLGVAGFAFVGWVTFCNAMNCTTVTLVLTLVLSSWSFAAAAILLTSRCWRRFDMRLDSPLLQS